jgi:hypothetical protein
MQAFELKILFMSTNKKIETKSLTLRCSFAQGTLKIN